MKKIYFLLAGSLLASTAFAQVFWVEDFVANGCSRGQLLTSYSTANGTWTVASTGTNGNVGNQFYVSSTSTNTGAGNCSDNCIMNSNADNATLHVSNSAIVIPSFVSVGADTGASYFTGGFSSFGYVATTNLRAESPVINFTGQSNITISFIYLEGGQTTLDDAQLVFSPDGGTTWVVVDALAKTTGCAVGQWTAFTATLPASADNNPAVKFGFTWTNNDDGQGSDPSFAVDNIELASNPLGIPALDLSSVNVYATNGIINVHSAYAWNLVSVTNMLGENVSAERNGNEIMVSDRAAGVYLVTLEINGQRVVRKLML